MTIYTNINGKYVFYDLNLSEVIQMRHIYKITKSFKEIFKYVLQDSYMHNKLFAFVILNNETYLKGTYKITCWGVQLQKKIVNASFQYIDDNLDDNLSSTIINTTIHHFGYFDSISEADKELSSNMPIVTRKVEVNTLT